MDATALTVVSQLITDARTRFGAHEVTSIEVAPELLDQAMEQVLGLGGQVTTDSCVVDGVTIRELGTEADGDAGPSYPVVHLRDGGTERLTPLEGDPE
jgi:hypothetical protein